jgi:hypothetical protein
MMLRHWMWGTAHPKTQCNFLEDLHLQKYIIIITIIIIILELGRVRQLRHIPCFPRCFGLFSFILIIQNHAILWSESCNFVTHSKNHNFVDAGCDAAEQE